MTSYKNPKKQSQTKQVLNQQPKKEINSELKNEKLNEEILGQINDYQKQQALKFAQNEKFNKNLKEKTGNKAKIGNNAKQGNLGKIGKQGKIGNFSNSSEKNHLVKDNKIITYAKLYEDPNLDGINLNSAQGSEYKPGLIYQHDPREQEQKAFRLVWSI